VRLNRQHKPAATTSLLVGELDRAGFVERHEDEADRRRTIVSLQGSGVARAGSDQLC
jgi:DNA-binding MarR family transcriptional regulator